jgi:nitrate/TMAO reductase-like tetraheme cytochrome c subunit
MNLFRISKNHIWNIALLVLIIFTSLALTGCQFVATNPRACQDCHPNLYDMWKESKVHPKSKSDCEDCHVKARYQSKPLYLAAPSTVNNHCESCHEDVFEQIQVEKVKLIKISHKRHLNENITCFTCHRNVAHDKETPSTYRPRKKVCLSCHLREIEGSPQDEACMMCHYIILDQSTALFWAQDRESGRPEGPSTALLSKDALISTTGIKLE